MMVLALALTYTKIGWLLALLMIVVIMEAPTPARFIYLSGQVQLGTLEQELSEVAGFEFLALGGAFGSSVSPRRRPIGGWLSWSERLHW